MLFPRSACFACNSGNMWWFGCAANVSFMARDKFIDKAQTFFLKWQLRNRHLRLSRPSPPPFIDHPPSPVEHSYPACCAYAVYGPRSRRLEMRLRPPSAKSHPHASRDRKNNGPPPSVPCPHPHTSPTNPLHQVSHNPLINPTITPGLSLLAGLGLRSRRHPDFQPAAYDICPRAIPGSRREARHI